MPSGLNAPVPPHVAPVHSAPAVMATRRSLWPRVGTIVALAASVSLAHVATSAHHAALHAVYEYAYYLPILMAANWFGAPGGLLTAFLCAALYLPHIRVTWADNAPYAASQYGELLAFHLIGGIVGLLVGRLQHSTAQAQAAAHALSTKNRELMESHQHLTRAERLSSLGTLAAGLAHEVRTPIAAIKGALEILSSRARPGTPEAEFTGVATKELARLGTLLEEFLAYARPRPPARVPLRLSDVVAQVHALLSAETRALDVRIERRSDAAGALTADPSQLTQVVLNVVLNAVQASPRGGTVEILLGEDDGTVVLEVRDAGPGLPLEQAARVFEPFFTTKAKGTGLGLPIAHRIVTAHEGTIELLPRQPQGTRAIVRLPRSPRMSEEPLA